MTFSETAREAPAMAAENNDQPLLRAAVGLDWKSAKEGAAVEVRPNEGCCELAGGSEVLPNP